MQLSTINNGTPDGALVIVSYDHRHMVSAEHIAPNLLDAISRWDEVLPKLESLHEDMFKGNTPSTLFDYSAATAPLPRSWQWLDGSVFPQHSVLMQQAFKMPPIESDVPLIYQGMSDKFYSGTEKIPFRSEADGIDFEGEFAVIVDAVPMGTTAEEALQHIKLVIQLNDWSLRTMAPAEMKTGFGFLQAKPACSVAAVAITPSVLGKAWRNGRVCLPLNIELNGKAFGHANGDEMEYGFHELIEHAAATRSLPAGTIIGSGTVSNSNYVEVGSSCLSERRAIDMIEFGEMKTPFMSFGDHIKMEALSEEGKAIFGPIDQHIYQFNR